MSGKEPVTHHYGKVESHPVAHTLCRRTVMESRNPRNAPIPPFANADNLKDHVCIMETAGSHRETF